jgi:hypothetical protein
MLPVFTAVLLLGAPPQAADNQIQVQLDVVLASMPATDFASAGCKIHTIGPGCKISTVGPDCKCKFGLLSAQECLAVHEVLQASRAAGRSKIFAAPKLVTLGGRPAHFLCGGKQAVLRVTGNDKSPSIDFVDVGTDLEMLPIALNNGCIYLETHSRFRSVDPGKGITTPFGFAPGFDEESIRTAVEMPDGATFAIWHPGTVVADSDAECGQLFLVSAHLVRNAEAPAAKSAQEQRLEKKAAALVEKYHAACKGGDLEKARKLARQALDLDPACFDKTVSKAAQSGVSILKGCSHFFPDQPSHMTPDRVHGGID